ncbi:hypothetical protein [Flavobacterium sp.]|uniref:hypothetical protein n=1 Tax=Flavobacterium sp. TaxID=239 RepID=UPI00262C64C1|nr:hypothetical protein [Flavobacterium sp.]
MEKTSLDYLEGILHTYSSLNMPNSTLQYEYEIVKVSKIETETEIVTDLFKLPAKCKMAIKEISKEKFRKGIYTWFFNNGELSTINLNERRKNIEVDCFIKNLYSAIEIQKITIIEFDKWNETFYELGIGYEYYFLHSSNEKYLLYFRYDD